MGTSWSGLTLPHIRKFRRSGLPRALRGPRVLNHLINPWIIPAGCAQTASMGDLMVVVCLLCDLCSHVCQVPDPSLTSILKGLLLDSQSRHFWRRELRIKEGGKLHLGQVGNGDSGKWISGIQESGN